MDIPLNSRGIYSPLELRIWKYIEPEPNSGCWLWSGYATGGDPYVGDYGYISVEGQPKRAHRVMYEIINDIVLSPKDILSHKCDIPLCVNPDHLSIGTQQDNINDMISKNRGHWQKNG